MRTPRTTPLLLCLLAFSTCGFITSVSSMQDPKADFSTLHTYAWLPKNLTAPQDPRFDNTLVNAKVKDSADVVLQEKGYRPATDSAPDFLVAWRITSKDYAGDDKIPNYWGYFPIYQGGIGFYTSPVEEGSLIIDVADGKTKHLIWRGVGERQIVENESIYDRMKQLQSEVRKVMAKLPPD